MKIITTTVGKGEFEDIVTTWFEVDPEAEISTKKVGDMFITVVNQWVSGENFRCVFPFSSIDHAIDVHDSVVESILNDTSIHITMYDDFQNGDYSIKKSGAK